MELDDSNHSARDFDERILKVSILWCEYKDYLLILTHEWITITPVSQVTVRPVREISGIVCIHHGKWIHHQRTLVVRLFSIHISHQGGCNWYVLRHLTGFRFPICNQIIVFNSVNILLGDGDAVVILKCSCFVLWYNHFFRENNNRILFFRNGICVFAIDERKSSDS